MRITPESDAHGHQDCLARAILFAWISSAATSTWN